MKADEVLRECLKVNESVIERLEKEQTGSFGYTEGHKDGYIQALKGVNEHIRESLGENLKDVI